jgi:hypothetical protein
MTKDIGTTHRGGYFALVIALTLMGGTAGRAQDAPGGSRSVEWRGLERALRLVHVDPRWRVVLIDPELAPDPTPLEALDAFIVREPDGRLRPVIYINRRSAIVQQATAGSALYVDVLAAVIHHEAQHLDGASEADASRAEQQFFRSLIGKGTVPVSTSLRYLSVLARRQDQIAMGSPRQEREDRRRTFRP